MKLINSHDLPRTGYFIDNKNGNIHLARDKPLLFPTTKNAIVVKAFAKLSRLMAYLNRKNISYSQFVYVVDFLNLKNSGAEYVVKIEYYLNVNPCDIYFTKRANAELLITSKEWRRVLNNYFKK